MPEYGSFGLAPDPSDQELVSLRSKIKQKLHDAPLADPHRCSLGGVAISRDLIDGYNVLTFPGVLFETLPMIRTNKYGSPMKAFMSHPSMRELSFELSRSAVKTRADEVDSLSALLSAALFRIFQSMEGIEWERDVGYTSPIPKTSETFLNPKEHWITKISASGNSSSPNMMFRSKRMLVADVLMNLAYPATKTYTFSLRRICGVRKCVNPAHYIQGWKPKPIDYPEIEEMDFGYHLAIGTMRGPGVKSIPKYYFNAIENEAGFSSSWKEYLDGAEGFWRRYEAQIPTEDKGPLPTSADAVLALLGGKKKKDQDGGPQLGDLFKAMGGRWARE